MGCVIMGTDVLKAAYSPRLDFGLERIHLIDAFKLESHNESQLLIQYSIYCLKTFAVYQVK